MVPVECTKTSYRVIYNQDDSALFGDAVLRKEPITPAHVDHMVDEVADGGADVLLVCPGAQKANYPSRVWETYWADDAAGGEADNTALLFGEMRRLAEQCDYLERAMARCRHKGIVPGVTLRMNDMHGVGDQRFFCRFYTEHPEWHLPNIAGRSWAAEAYNYEIPEIREYHLAIVRELVTTYDVDVVELDFLRFSAYFDRGETERHAATMTRFLGDVRAVLDGTGRKIALLPRVAATPGGARELGFDLRAWAQAGLVDGITVGQFLCTGWECPIDRFRALVGPDLPLYAANDSCAYDWGGLSRLELPLQDELLRGFAAGYLAAGADGVNIFNFFIAREQSLDPAREPHFNMLRELRDLAELRVRPRRHAITSGFKMVESDLPNQVPVDLAPSQARAFRVILAAEGPGMGVEVEVTLEGTCACEDLWLLVNDMPAGPAVRIAPKEMGDLKCGTAVFPLRAGVVRDGWNELVVRCENTPVRIVGLETCVRAEVQAARQPDGG